MNQSENIFEKYGFKYQVFNPHGVTEGLNIPVPLPVGAVKKVISRVLPEIDRTVHYSSNILIPIVGDYGSGKTELMNFIYRYLMQMSNKNPKIGIIRFYRYSPLSDFNLIKILEESISKEDLDSDKYTRRAQDS